MTTSQISVHVVHDHSRMGSLDLLWWNIEPAFVKYLKVQQEHPDCARHVFSLLRCLAEISQMHGVGSFKVILGVTLHPARQPLGNVVFRRDNQKVLAHNLIMTDTRNLSINY